MNLPIRHLSILAAGDSLTSGWSNHGLKTFPYPSYLKQKLIKKVNGNISIDNIGIPGSTLFGIESNIKTSFSSNNYDIIIIFGGVNDLSHNREFEECFNHLSSIVKYCFENEKNNNCIIFLLTLTGILNYPNPNTYVTQFNQMIANFNQKIRQLTQGSMKSRLFLIDWAKIIPMDNKHIDNDGVHYKQAGYELLAEYIYNSILPFVEKHLNTGNF